MGPHRVARLVGATVALVLAGAVPATAGAASSPWRASAQLGATSPGRVACGSTTCLAIATNATNTIDAVGANGAWRTLYTVTGSTTSTTSFSDLACDGSLCVAVANSTGTRRGHSVTGPDAFVTTSAGRTWSGHALAKVTGATTTQVLDVACAGPRSCVAVGNYFGPTSTGGVAWTTDDAGATWTGRTLPRGVVGGPLACTSPRACVMASGAIGVTTSGPGGFRRVATPHPWGSRTPTFRSVACAGGGCVVAGYATPSGQACTSRSCVPVLLATRDGRPWESVSLPHALAGQLVEVSCTSAPRCVAVGDAPSTNPLGGSSEVVRGAIGAPWTTLRLPRPSAGTWIGATGVGCTPQGRCRTGELYDRRAGLNYPYSLAGPL